MGNYSAGELRLADEWPTRWGLITREAVCLRESWVEVRIDLAILGG